MNIKTVKGRLQVISAFKKGKRFTLPEAMVSVRPRSYAQEYDAPKNSEDSLFIVCSVRKKIAPHAVIRNRLKRLVKESVRQYIRTHADNNNIYLASDNVTTNFLFGSSTINNFGQSSTLIGKLKN